MVDGFLTLMEARGVEPLSEDNDT